MTTHEGHDHNHEDQHITDTMTSGQDLTGREQAILHSVSEAFSGMHVETGIVPVHTLDGKEVSTLRFTLGGLASADLHRDRIAEGESTETLASGVVMQLRQQLPVTLEDNQQPIDPMLEARAGPSAASAPSSQMAHDPVCHMDIRVDDAVGRVTHNGLTYYFCSEGCRKTFESDPDRILEAEAAAHADARAGMHRV